MRKQILLLGLLFFAGFYACQKDALTSSDFTSGNVAVTDRGGDGHGHMHGDSTGNHHPDSLWHHHHDSLGHHHLDSLWHHHHDSLGHHPHHGDSTGHPPHDSTWTPGGHPPHGPHGPGGACTAATELITVADLPQAAQDWLAANQAGATIESVVKRTKPDCSVYYKVKIEGGGVIRFDADGNKI